MDGWMDAVREGAMEGRKGGLIDRQINGWTEGWWKDGGTGFGFWKKYIQ